MEKSSRKQAIITIAVVAITIFAVFAAILLAKKKSNKNLATTTDTTSNTNASQNTTSDQNASSTNQTNTATLKDGTYKATGSYTSPGGNEQITVSVTLKDGVVTDTSATSGANDPTAKQYQSEFIAGYKDQVVGKKISAIKLSRVSGSSLTSQGFNNALKQIQQQAQA